LHGKEKKKKGGGREEGNAVFVLAGCVGGKGRGKSGGKKGSSRGVGRPRPHPVFPAARGKRSVKGRRRGTKGVVFPRVGKGKTQGEKKRRKVENPIAK